MRIIPEYTQKGMYMHKYEFRQADIRLTLCNIQDITPNKYDLFYDKLIVERDMELYDAILTSFRSTGNPTLDALYLRLKMFKEKINTVDLQSEEIQVLITDLLSSLDKGLLKLLNGTLDVKVIKADYIKCSLNCFDYNENDVYSFLPFFRLYEHITDEGIKDWGIYASLGKLRIEEHKKSDIHPMEQDPEFVYVIEEEIEKMGITAVEVLSYLRDNGGEDYGSIFGDMFFTYEHDEQVIRPEFLKYSPIIKGEEVVNIPRHYFIGNTTSCDSISTWKDNYKVYKSGGDIANQTLYLHRMWDLIGKFIPSITTNRKQLGFVRYMYKVYNTEQEARAIGGTVKKILKTDFRVSLSEGDFMFHYTLQRLFEV